MKIAELNRQRMNRFAELSSRVRDILDNVDLSEPKALLAARSRALELINETQREDREQVAHNLFRVKRETPVPEDILLWSFRIEDAEQNLEDRLTMVEQNVRQHFEDVTLTIYQTENGTWVGRMSSRSGVNRIAQAGDYFETLMRKESFHAYQEAMPR